MNSNYKATEADYYHYMRGRLFKPVVFLESAGIVFIIASFVMNPYLAAGLGNTEAMLLAAIILVGLVKALSPSVLVWRAGTIAYSVLLTLIFALEVKAWPVRATPSSFPSSLPSGFTIPLSPPPSTTVWPFSVLPVPLPFIFAAWARQPACHPPCLPCWCSAYSWWPSR
jgi:hypothetical protein